MSAVCGLGLRVKGLSFWGTQTSYRKQPLRPTKETRNRPAPFRCVPEMIAELEGVVYTRCQHSSSIGF